MENQASAFQAELQKLILRFRLEFQLTYAETIGVLEIEKHKLLKELTEP